MPGILWGILSGILLGVTGAMAEGAGPVVPLDPPAPGAIRVAQYNAALSRAGAGVLLGDIRAREAQVLGVASVILAVRPDVLVLNEIDRDGEGAALEAFAALLAEGVGGLEGLALDHRVQPVSNTGRPSGLDIDGDGEALGPADAWGYGAFPGQYAMAVLSRYPLEGLRTWRLLPWSAMPGALRPATGGETLHDDATWARLRLSSKTHLAVEVAVPGGPVALVAAHPTPPVFDGPADRNGRRNHDEIRLIGAIMDGAGWLVDDDGRPGGVDPALPVVVAGDLNADPADGDARRGALAALLSHPRLQDPRPLSEGAVAAAGQGGANARHRGAAEADTADWRDEPGPGNLRVDYVLPDARAEVTAGGVYWPAPGAPGADAAEASDHRLVWVDIRLP
ncbi:MAG: endonuclease/exonuclease/phosphatase family protein [Pseudomonadota bacterium]